MKVVEGHLPKYKTRGWAPYLRANWFHSHGWAPYLRATGPPWSYIMWDFRVKCTGDIVLPEPIKLAKNTRPAPTDK